MSDWKVADLSLARWGEDLEAVIEAIGPGEPFVVLGMSRGVAIGFRHARIFRCID
jgi:hypothetical protein